MIGCLKFLHKHPSTTIRDCLICAKTLHTLTVDMLYYGDGIEIEDT